MSIKIDHVKCACGDCVCIVDVENAIQSESRIYCSEECAQHHTSGNGCHHAGCTCHG